MKKEITSYVIIMGVFWVSLYFLLFSSIDYFLTPLIQIIFWTHVLVGTLSIGISILYIIRFYQTRVNALLYLFGSMVTFVVLYFVQAISISILNLPNANPNIAKRMFYFGVSLGGIGPLLFVIFISSYVYSEVKPTEIALPVFYLGVLFSYVINDLQFGTETRGGFVFFAYKESVVFLNLIGFLMYLYVGIYAIYRMRETRDRIRDESLRRQQFLFMTGIGLVYLFTPIIFGLVSVFPSPRFQFYWINVISPTYIVAGISISAIQYLQSKKSAFLQPQPLHHLIVIKEGGSPILNYSFDINNQLIEVDEVLFSSAITAVSSLMEEAIDTQLTALKFQNQIAKTQFDEKLAFIVLIDFETSVIKRGLTNFAEDFTSYYQRYIQDNPKSKGKDFSDDQQVIELILNNFGY